MPQKKKNTITHNTNNELSNPRRSPRFLRSHNHTVPTTPKPSNSKSKKLKDSTKTLSNRKITTESRRAVAVRRSPRFASQNDEKPSKYDSSSSGSRRTVKSMGGDGGGAREEGGEEEEAKVNAKAKKKRCVVSSEEAAIVEGKERNGERNEGGEKPKRKRKRCGGGRGGEDIAAEGWTKEQELALQNAYFCTKPSPNFWKNVSKLVRGKSQQDCFDKIHGDHITPPQPQPRSRARTIKSSPIQPFSISASKLLKPIDKKVKRSNILKPKNCITQKSVEKLLQSRLHLNQDREGDIFSVLEPNIDFPTNASQPSAALSTPKQLKENQGLLQSCTETSSSSHKKKSLSRFSGSRITNLVSPPVLKQVKNKGLHEKYINQLRCRESKRRANSARIQMPITGKVVGEGSSIQKMDVVKAAKVALVSEARDAINKFQQSQIMYNTTCSDEDNSDDIGVEDESQ